MLAGKDSGQGVGMILCVGGNSWHVGLQSSTEKTGLGQALNTEQAPVKPLGPGCHRSGCARLRLAGAQKWTCVSAKWVFIDPFGVHLDPLFGNGLGPSSQMILPPQTGMEQRDEFKSPLDQENVSALQGNG